MYMKESLPTKRDIITLIRASLCTCSLWENIDPDERGNNSNLFVGCAEDLLLPKIQQEAGF